MNTRESIETAIRDAIEDVTGKSTIEKDTNLVYKGSGIAPVNFLYIFDIVEKKLCLSVFDIFKTHSYQVMTIENLVEAIYRLEK